MRPSSAANHQSVLNLDSVAPRHVAGVHIPPQLRLPARDRALALDDQPAVQRDTAQADGVLAVLHQQRLHDVSGAYLIDGARRRLKGCVEPLSCIRFGFGPPRLLQPELLSLSGPSNHRNLSEIDSQFNTRSFHVACS